MLADWEFYSSPQEGGLSRSVAPLPAVEDPDLIPELWYGLQSFCCTFAPSRVQTEEMGRQHFLKKSIANGGWGERAWE